MVGYLQSKDRVKERLKIGREEVHLTVSSDAEVQKLPLVGSFSVIAGRRALFYRWNGELRLRFGEDPPIELNISEAFWECQGNQAKFTLHQLGSELLNESYPLVTVYRPADLSYCQMLWMTPETQAAIFFTPSTN